MLQWLVLGVCAFSGYVNIVECEQDVDTRWRYPLKQDPLGGPNVCSAESDTPCCDGWIQEYRHGPCTKPLCMPGCLGGVCVAPNLCQCRDGRVSPRCDLSKSYDTSHGCHQTGYRYGAGCGIIDLLGMPEVLLPCSSSYDPCYTEVNGPTERQSDRGEESHVTGSNRGRVRPITSGFQERTLSRQRSLDSQVLRHQCRGISCVKSHSKTQSKDVRKECQGSNCRSTFHIRSNQVKKPHTSSNVPARSFRLSENNRRKKPRTSGRSEDTSSLQRGAVSRRVTDITPGTIKSAERQRNAQLNSFPINLKKTSRNYQSEASSDESVRSGNSKKGRAWDYLRSYRRKPSGGRGNQLVKVIHNSRSGHNNAPTKIHKENNLRASSRKSRMKTSAVRTASQQQSVRSRLPKQHRRITQRYNHKIVFRPPKTISNNLNSDTSLTSTRERILQKPFPALYQTKDTLDDKSITRQNGNQTRRRASPNISNPPSVQEPVVKQSDLLNNYEPPSSNPRDKERSKLPHDNDNCANSGKPCQTPTQHRILKALGDPCRGRACNLENGSRRGRPPVALPCIMPFCNIKSPFNNPDSIVRDSYVDGNPVFPGGCSHSDCGILLPALCPATGCTPVMSPVSGSKCRQPGECNRIRTPCQKGTACRIPEEEVVVEDKPCQEGQIFVEHPNGFRTCEDMEEFFKDNQN